TDIRSDRDDFFTAALPAPQLTAAPQEEPNLLDRPVCHRYRRRPRGELEVGHPAACQPQEDPHVGSVRGDGVASYREPLGAELAHRFPSSNCERARRRTPTLPRSWLSSSGHSNTRHPSSSIRVYLHT